MSHSNNYEGMFPGVPAQWLSRPVQAVEADVNTASSQFTGIYKRSKIDGATKTALTIIAGTLVVIAVLIVKALSTIDDAKKVDKLGTETESELRSESREHLDSGRAALDRVVADAKDAINAVSGESLIQIDRVASEAAAEVKGNQTS